MRKRMSKILSILLVSTLVVTTGNVVRAEDAEEPATEVQVTEEPVEPEEKAPEIMVEPEEKVPEVAAEPEEMIKEEEPAVSLEEDKKEDNKEETPAEEATEAEINALQAEEIKELGMMDVAGASNKIVAQAILEQKIPLNRIVTGLEPDNSLDGGAIVYGNVADFKKGGAYQYGYAEPVFLTKGTLLMTVANVANGFNSTQSVWFGLYRDPGLTQAVDSYKSVSVGATERKVFQVPGNGTYYMGVSSDIYSKDTVGISVGVVASFFDGSDRTLTSGQQVAVGSKEGQTTYFKFKAAKTGYIKTYGNENARTYRATLLNSKKKALSKDTALQYNPTYGVKKGVTYYIAVKSHYDNTNGSYAFKFTNNSIKEKSGSKKSKAVTIKRNKTKKGTIQASTKKSEPDWYKIKKTNRKKMTVTVKGKTNDRIKVTVYKGGRLCSSRSFWYNEGGVKITLTNYPKGTYYVKVDKADKYCSGYYTLKWK